MKSFKTTISFAVYSEDVNEEDAKETALAWFYDTFGTDLEDFTQLGGEVLVKTVKDRTK